MFLEEIQMLASSGTYYHIQRQSHMYNHLPHPLMRGALEEREREREKKQENERKGKGRSMTYNQRGNPPKF